MKVYSLIILTFMTGCQQGRKDSGKQFIVSKYSSYTPYNSPSPINIYLPFNFIVDSVGEIFFYQQEMIFGSDDVYHDIPQFINLKPKDIIHVPATGIEDFIQLNILNVEQEDSYVSIALIRDSIQSEGLSKIINKLNDETNITRWLLRHATEEESTVLFYKKIQKRYFVDDIKWDFSRIQFAENSRK